MNSGRNMMKITRFEKKGSDSQKIKGDLVAFKGQISTNGGKNDDKDTFNFQKSYTNA